MYQSVLHLVLADQSVSFLLTGKSCNHFSMFKRLGLTTPVWGFHARMIWNDDKYHFEKFLFTISKAFMWRLGSSLFHI